MDEERKSTFLRDDDGDFKPGAELLIIVLAFGGLFLFIIGFVVGISAIQDKYEVEVFNRMHGTDYTWGEWFWSEGTIKEYITGHVENQNYQIDLNIKNLPIELQGGKE